MVIWAVVAEEAAVQRLHIDRPVVGQERVRARVDVDAVARHASILVLDEATSNLDETSDASIQQLLRTEFGTSTVLTIAHRLNTILDADKVLVLDEGRAVEYGAPRELVRRPRGIFREMVGEAGQPEYQRAV